MNNMIKVTKNNYDEDKENYLVITHNFHNKTRDAQQGYTKYVIKTLEEKFNVFILELNLTLFQNNFINDSNINSITFDKKNFSKNFIKEFKHKRDDDYIYGHNQDTMFRLLGESELSELRIDYIFAASHYYSITGFIGGLVSDSLNPDEEFIKKNKHSLENVFEWLSPYVSITFPTMIFMFIVKYFDTKNETKLINFAYEDPTAVWTQFFDSLNMKSQMLHSVKDYRGVRRSEEFPIGQLRYLYIKEEYPSLFDRPKDKLLIYNSSLLMKNGSRQKEYETYLKYLNLERSSIYTFTMLTHQARKASKADIKKIEKNGLSEFRNELLMNPMIREPHSINDEYNIVREYKYALLLKPLPPNDSVNHKLTYVIVDTLPLFAENYDPDNLIGIDTKIKKMLTVSNHKEIEEKINYFEIHQDEYNKILNKLKKFLNQNFMEENYKTIISDILFRPLIEK